MPLTPAKNDFLRSIRPHDAAGHHYRDDFAYLAYAALYDFAAAQIEHLRVLDAGCGLGFGSRILAQTARAVTAIDVDEAALQYARQHYQHPNLQFLHSDACRSDFADGTFDAIVCVEVIEHLPAALMTVLMQEWTRLLAPQGFIILSTPNRSVYDRISRTPDHINEMTVDAFFSMLKRVFREVSPYYQRKGEWDKFAAYYQIIHRDRLGLRHLIPAPLRRILKSKTASGRHASWPELWEQLQIHPATALSEVEDAVVQIALCQP